MSLLLNLAEVVVYWFLVWWVKSFLMVLFVLYVMFMLVFLNILVMNLVCGPIKVKVINFVLFFVGVVWVSCYLCSLVFIVDIVLSSSWGSDFMLCRMWLTVSCYLFLSMSLRG